MNGGAAELRRKLEQGETTSVGLVDTLAARAHVSGFSQPRHDEARREAAVLDAERRAGALRGPLHGLPITVKENIDVAGMRSSVGLRASVTTVATDAVIVRALRDAGAIVLGKSNVPQGLLSMHCDNALYGPTPHPLAPAHVAGGSSSGEGALLACGASVLGIGSDLGGSIRFPAAFCGVVGFKPTQDLWSNRGVQTAIRGQEFVRAQVGPMARRVADVRLLLDAAPPARLHRWDARVPPVELAASSGPLRVGVFEHDGVTPPNPAMRRAVREAADALADAGHELVPFAPMHREELVLLYLAAVSSDGMATLQARFGGEPPEPGTRLMWRLGRAPRLARGLAARVLDAAGERTIARVVGRTGRSDVAAFWALVARREQLREEVEAAWREAGLDAVVCPASASPAPPIGMERDASIMFSHYCPYNVFGMPAGVVPWTRVRADETRVAKTPREDRIERRLRLIAARSEGLPVAVQVAGPRFRDPDVLALMERLEAAAGASRMLAAGGRDDGSSGAHEGRVVE